MRRFPRLFAIVAIAICAELVLSTSPAFAGATAPPPSRGYATYNRPSLTTTCDAGSPAKITFAYHYNATKLQVGYWVNVTGYVGNPHTLDQVNLPKKLVHVLPGSHGVLSRTFAVPAAAGAGWQVGVWAQAKRKTSQYHYVGRNGRLSCAHTIYHGLVAATVTMGGVNCQHVGHLTFDNTNGNTAWYYTIFLPGGLFAPSEHAVKAGTLEHRKLTDVNAGEVVNIDVTNAAGNAYIGRFHFRQGC